MEEPLEPEPLEPPVLPLEPLEQPSRPPQAELQPLGQAPLERVGLVTVGGWDSYSSWAERLVPSEYGHESY